MSLCLRSISIPNKFISLVNTPRQVTRLNHTLSEHVKLSLFLKEFLGMQAKMNAVVSSSKSSMNPLISLLEQNIPTTFFKTQVGKLKICNEKYHCNKQQTLTLHQQKKINEITSTKWIFKNTLPSSKRERILYSNISPNVKDVNEKQPKDRKSPKEHLSNVFKHLQRDLPLLFVKTMDFNIYTSDLIFINNIRGTTTTGIVHYINQISLLKLVGHIKYAYVKLNILKMTMHPEDNTVKIRWRIEGVSNAKVLLLFWKFKFWNMKDQTEGGPTWYDGFSTFYVNNDGKIYKHIVDKLMPDQEQEKLKTPIEPKLALFTSLLSLNLNYFDKVYLKKYILDYFK
ncbi:uncharacterized protein LOC117610720 isoform X1 [Osmia lignaria lignaria]|uniref:uncharacterized protein C6orf136 isoform X1 n=1 Tax=Osmia lignaria TaxID=473952 RepID=UPI00147950DE|nr:uncharacterized protein C6orf136 isoform X1 [Osmia lignaria]XP_034194327.1 uncharacterized protein C6orf136 isoform X1 [Osmia lignaria]XP_034194328.1 uncharacterized protein C6orf136 isoform X1 [Osmia lignaria]